MLMEGCCDIYAIQDTVVWPFEGSLKMRPWSMSTGTCNKYYQDNPQQEGTTHSRSFHEGLGGLLQFTLAGHVCCKPTASVIRPTLLFTPWRDRFVFPALSRILLLLWMVVPQRHVKALKRKHN
jgi:hypothetical protein